MSDLEAGAWPNGIFVNPRMLLKNGPPQFAAPTASASDALSSVSLHMAYNSGQAAHSQAPARAIKYSPSLPQRRLEHSATGVSAGPKGQLGHQRFPPEHIQPALPGGTCSAASPMLVVRSSKETPQAGMGKTRRRRSRCKMFRGLLQAGWAQLPAGNYRQHAVPAWLRSVDCTSRLKRQALAILGCEQSRSELLRSEKLSGLQTLPVPLPQLQGLA